MIILATLVSLAVLWWTPEARGASSDVKVDETPAGDPYVAGELLVTYKEGIPSPAARALPDEARIGEELRRVEAQLIEFPDIKAKGAVERAKLVEEKKEEIQANPAVEAVDYNYLREFSFIPNDPRFGAQWNLRKVAAPRAWDTVRGGGTKIAIVDSGIAAKHPDLRRKIAAQRDFVNGDRVAEDDVGHGSHVAGIAAAATNNGKGIAGGCPNCKLLIAKVGDRNTLTDRDIIKGINWSVDRGAKAINLSMGAPGKSSILEKAINRAWNRGVVVVGAAGNENTSKVSYPAGYRNVISVAATTRKDRKARFSNFGTTIDLAAPGVDIISTIPRGRYASHTGTSMAAPHVTALAGLLADKNLSATKIRRRMQSTAKDLGPNGKDRYYGHGRVDFAAAVK